MKTERVKIKHEGRSHQGVCNRDVKGKQANHKPFTFAFYVTFAFWHEVGMPLNDKRLHSYNQPFCSVRGGRCGSLKFPSPGLSKHHLKV